MRIAYELSVAVEEGTDLLHSLRFTVAVDQLSSVSDPVRGTCHHTPSAAAACQGNSGSLADQSGVANDVLAASAAPVAPCSSQKYFAWTALHAPLGSGGGGGATFELLQAKPKPGLLKVANSTEGAELVSLTLSSLDSLGCSTQLTVDSASHVPPQVRCRVRSLDTPFHPHRS